MARFGYPASSASAEAATGQSDETSTLQQDVTADGDYKSTSSAVEQKKPVFWDWYSDVGYISQYNFRGTNLTPGSDGAGFFDAEVSKWDFTLGFWGIHQFGTARAPSFSIGEGGGGGATGIFRTVTLSPETVQTRFNEIDVFLQYHRQVGPVDLTVGNIGFFIERSTQTFVNTSLLGLYGPFPTVEDEQFDRVYISIGTSLIPHVQPGITYYQTLYNDGQDHLFYTAPHIPPNGTFIFYGGTSNSHERNDRLGGYLEGRLRGSFSLTHWLDFNPYGVISYSFHDRNEPVTNAVKFRDILRGRSLVGFNAAQVGLELPIHLLHAVGNSNGPYAPPNLTLRLVPFMAYSYHISMPTAGTDRNEVWGGVKFSSSF